MSAVLTVPLRRLIATVLLPACALPVLAQEDFQRCAAIEAATSRLACYDRLAGRGTGREVIERSQPADIAAVAATATSPAIPAHRASLLDTAWELEQETETFRVRPYKPVYLLPLFVTNHVNRAPSTPSLGGVGGADGVADLKGQEAKFQLSFKTKLADNLIGDNGDLWAGYTQSSRWQVYNKNISRPFRETDYEPEMMFVWRTNKDVLGLASRYASLGINHQSNGRGAAFSRSWNRVVAAFGFEREDWTLTLRPWWRLPERSGNDDNPDIADYAGRGEVLLTKVVGGHVLSLQARHSLRGGSRSHGSLEMDWAFPISGRLKGHVQWHSGYAESLIDYNHRANYLGLGISLVEWH